MPGMDLGSSAECRTDDRKNCQLSVAGPLPHPIRRPGLKKSTVLGSHRPAASWEGDVLSPPTALVAGRGRDLAPARTSAPGRHVDRMVARECTVPDGGQGMHRPSVAYSLATAYSLAQPSEKSSRDELISQANERSVGPPAITRSPTNAAFGQSAPEK